MVLFRWGLYVSRGVLATAAAAAAVYATRGVLTEALIALFLAISLDPAVRMLMRWPIQRGVAILVVVLVALGLTAAFLQSVIPTLVDQFQAMVAVLTIYFLADLPRLQRGAVQLFPRAHRDRFARIAGVMVDKVGSYMIGNIAISLIAGVAAFAALTALGVPFAVPLAFLVAVTDFIPLIGALMAIPITAGIKVLLSERLPARDAADGRGDP
jgi:predicted PurR-regulated permease PerM